jgi:hypothetical protein
MGILVKQYPFPVLLPFLRFYWWATGIKGSPTRLLYLSLRVFNSHGSWPICRTLEVGALPAGSKVFQVSLSMVVFFTDLHGTIIRSRSGSSFKSI